MDFGDDLCPGLETGSRQRLWFWNFIGLLLLSGSLSLSSGFNSSFLFVFIVKYRERCFNELDFFIGRDLIFLFEY